MSKNEIGQDSPIPKFIYLKIRRRDGIESLTILEEGEFKVPIEGCIKVSKGGFLLTQHLLFVHFTTFACPFLTVIFSNCQTNWYASFDTEKL